MSFISDSCLWLFKEENRSFCLSPKQVRHSAERCPKPSLLSCKSLDLKIALLQLVFLLFVPGCSSCLSSHAPGQTRWGQQQRGGCAAAGSWVALRRQSLHGVWKVCREGPDGIVKLFYLAFECPLAAVSHLARGPGALLRTSLPVSALESLQNVPFSRSEIFCTKKTPAGLQNRSC